MMQAAPPDRKPMPAWRCRGRALDGCNRPLVMGILNCTPDSFSDGGRYLDPERAVQRGMEMIDQGADIVDVGGESTRPGAAPVSAEEESRRVESVIRALSGPCLERAGRGDRAVAISIDTSKAAVAERALAAGADIVNDITALTGDGRMAGVVLESGAGAILMHMQGEPRTMQQHPAYSDVVDEVVGFLGARLAALGEAGIPMENLAVDPGIGFGKTLEHNLALLGGLSAFGRLGRPVVVGISRKSFLGRLTGLPVDRRLIPGIAALSFCMTRGGNVFRVHDVPETVAAVRVVSSLLSGRAED